MAAEIAAACVSAAASSPRFNEAAANGRGNLVRHGQHRPDAHASMRPRRMAAEIDGRDVVGRPHGAASMRPRRMAAEIITGVVVGEHAAPLQ